VWTRFDLRDATGGQTLFETTPVIGRLLAGLELRFGDPR
jgi:hypothetical protein